MKFPFLPYVINLDLDLASGNKITKQKPKKNSLCEKHTHI